MPGYVALIVLLAALLHAVWNVAIKAGENRFYNSVLVLTGSASISLCALPFLAEPSRASWPYIAASATIHVAYFSLLGAAYRFGDMSVSYPLMRGAYPLLIAFASGPLIGESLPLPRWFAVALISFGVVGVAASGSSLAKGRGRAVCFALCTACVIAAYTLVDGMGVRKSAAPVGYTMWVFLSAGLVLLCYVAVQGCSTFAAYARRFPHIAVVGGACTLGSYGAALWAMTRATVASVAALRETSILFAAFIAVFFLHERMGRQRWVAIGAILAGAFWIRLT